MVPKIMGCLKSTAALRFERGMQDPRESDPNHQLEASLGFVVPISA